ncbi:hypothetical protein KKG56_02105, partial [bacterium]|nr:hypothetical protein [bacterium]
VVCGNLCSCDLPEVLSFCGRLLVAETGVAAPLSPTAFAEAGSADAIILTHIFGGQNSDGKCCKTTETCIAK